MDDGRQRPADGAGIPDGCHFSADAWAAMDPAERALAEAAVEAYRPDTIAEHRHDALLPAVRRIVRAVPVFSVDGAQRLTGMLTAFAAHAEDLGRDPDDLVGSLRVDVVDHYIAKRLPGQASSSVASQRSALERSGRMVNPDGWPPRRQAIGRTGPVPPITDSEIVATAAAYRSVGPPWTPRGICSLYAGLACGAGRFDLGHLRTEHFSLVDGHPTLRLVGLADRTVPARDEWAAPLAAAFRDAPRGWVAGLHDAPRLGKNAVSQVNAAIRGCDAPPFNVDRARNRWIVDHLDDRTPTVALVAAAGLSTLNPVYALLPHATDITDRDRFEVLRGRGAS